MRQLSSGEFFGQTDRIVDLDGLMFTNTLYTHAQVDWHYHENAYFTLMLAGCMREGHKKSSYQCGPGTLLFHHWQDPHYNIKAPGYVRGFHVEMASAWATKMDIDLDRLQGSFMIQSYDVKLPLYRIVQEMRSDDESVRLSMESYMLQALGSLLKIRSMDEQRYPEWVLRVRDMLHEEPAENLTLAKLAHTVGLHPVHVSRMFPKYFNCTMGEYRRKIRVSQAMEMLSEPTYSLTAIAHACGFSDQSHFIRCFREFCGASPAAYRKIITGK